jgi:elongation factor P
MLEYNEILPKKVIIMDGAPHVVLSSVISKKSRQQASNQTKLKNVITGSVTNHAFHQRDKLEEAEIDTKEVMYLYNNKGEWWFCESGDRSKRFFLSQEQVGDGGKFLKENTLIEALVFNETVFDMKLPAKVDLKVTEAPPGVRGNTSSGGTKQVTLETGAVVSVPLFIEEGEVIRVNTETGNYSERVSK